MSAESGGRHPLLVWAWSLLRLKFVGVAFGAVFFCLSLTPSLLPRDWLFQGLIGGVRVSTVRRTRVISARCNDILDGWAAVPHRMAGPRPIPSASVPH